MDFQQLRIFFQSNKKRIILLALILAAILVVSGIILFAPKSQIDPNFDYSIEPSNWILEENDTVFIDVPIATSGHGSHIFTQERYIEGNGQIISMFIEGNYAGEPFKRVFNGEEGPLMRISPDMIPNDGVIDSFALFKKEEGKLVLYLFVDEDWKASSGEKIDIIWGPDIRNPATIYSRQFDFSHEVNGIYYDKIEDNLEWFANQNPVTGRVFFW